MDKMEISNEEGKYGKNQRKMAGSNILIGQRREESFLV